MELVLILTETELADGVVEIRKCGGGELCDKRKIKKFK